MTTYNYLDEMGRLCRRVSQAVIVTGDEKLQDFYLAAADGFENRLKKTAVGKAGDYISDVQYQSFRSLKDFCERKELKAATIQREAQEKKLA